MTSNLPTTPTRCAPALAAKILAVQAAVKAMEKTAANTFANFKYVPIDDYYKSMRPILDNAGLFVAISERSTEILEVAGKANYHAIFDIRLFDADGNHLNMRRSILTPFVGAQTAGAALSYIQKCFYRTTFNIATGEGGDFEATEKELITDPDGLPHAPNKITPTSRPAPTAKDFDYEGAPYRIFEGEKVRQSFNELNLWGGGLKKAIADNPETVLFTDNKDEVNRIFMEVRNDKTLSERKRESFLKAFNTISWPTNSPTRHPDAPITPKQPTKKEV